MGDTGAPSHLWICASDCLIRVTDTLQITISEQLTNKLTPNQTTRRVFRSSLWFPTLTKESNFLLINNQSWVLIQCSVAYLGMTGMSRWFFWAPGTQGRSRGINNVAGLVPVKQWPHYPLFACSTIVQNVFLQKVTIHLSKWFQWNNGLQASLPAVCLQCHLTIAKCISPKS